MTTSAASPYSTGGGGVRLEHRYAATLLAAVLGGDPVGELGDAVVPLTVRLQAGDISQIDDVVIDGRTADGGVQRVSVGVRRNPALTSSDSSSVPLVRSFLLVVTHNWDEVFAGRWRVALAVGVPSSAATQTAELARLAQSVGSAAAFRELVARPGATNQGVRTRLTHLDALVTAAVEGDAGLTAVGATALTWRWLLALRVRVLQLEGVDETDRTTAVAALRRQVADGSAATANSVFSALAELAGGWASAGAIVDQAMLRRALSAYSLRRSASYSQAWSVLDGLARRLREGVRPDLAAGHVRLEIDRADERNRLVIAMTEAGRAGVGIVVTGEPDVGKSALTLRAAEQMADEGAAVLSLSLRDLPASVVDVEHLLGAAIADVIAAGEVRPVRLLVVDGAEAVLEGRRDLLRELAGAALQAGVGMAAVTRTDGSTRVREVLQAATLSSGAPAVPAEHVVARLAQDERRMLVDTFTSLARLSADARVEWLVGRPGLVDVLLRGDTVVESSELLSEADVFVAVWNGLVRKHEERRPDGASPDDREQAVLAVARRSLNLAESSAPTGGVWAGLRSDGVLRSPANAALSAGDQFATDLMRDFALCRLFVVGGWEPLRTAGAPRWAIRAARLASQAMLLTADRVALWRDLHTAFTDLASQEGARWAEVPLEALLTLGDAQAAIEAVWDELVAEDQAGLRTLLRLAHQRYVTHTIGDPFALAPIVAVTFCSDRDLGQHDRHAHARSIGESVRELVLSWLRGMGADGRAPDPLRQQVRDRILASEPEAYDEFAVEALATLGRDTDAPAEQWLRGVATSDPYHLRSAVESVGAIVSLSEVRPQLLLELAEAYYVEHPEHDDWGGRGLLDEGIRDHLHGLGFGTPFAAWHFGPFFRLLNTLPVETLAFINRMLDHAARVRGQRAQRRWGGDLDDPDEIVGGLDLDIPGIGPRHYLGDAHVWGWYRGSTMGPYPCMSALLAVERFADHLINTLNLPPSVVVQLLLRDCHNLAMPGLVVGMLGRHLGKVGDLLDPWLTYPRVWSLESSRATGEGVLHVQGVDPDDLFGRERRQLTLRDAAAEMTLRAMAAGDQPRLDVLAAVAERLLANARIEAAENDSAPSDWLVVVEGWASVFHPENFHAHRAPDRSIIVQYEPPERVATGFAPTAAKFSIGNEALRLQLAYSDRNYNPTGWPTDTLIADIALARRLAENPPEYGPLHPEDPVTAVAAAAILSHARGLGTVQDDDLHWAADTVLTAAGSPRVDLMSYESTTYPMAADRAAARAIPPLLLAPFDHLALDPTRVSDAATALATSLFDEVRTAFVDGCAPVWAASCAAGAPPDGCSRHSALWAAVQAGLADCRLGAWNPETQSRPPEYLPPPYVDTLTAVPAKDMLVNRLAMPISCTAAARTAPCVAPSAAALLPVLLDAHRRGLDRLTTKGYAGYNDPQRELVARVLIDLTVSGEPASLVEHLQAFASNANALQQLLRDFAILFTYDPSLRGALPLVWPIVLETTLDAIDAGASLHGNGSRHWVDYALAALLPTPQLRTADSNPDKTLDQARVDWITPEALDGLADRWITLATGEPKAADAVVQFARTTPTAWQTTVGLAWLERIINNQYNQFSSRVWFVTNWLTELREATALGPDTLSQWRRIVDGLAAGGDLRAVDLQRIDE